MKTVFAHLEIVAPGNKMDTIIDPELDLVNRDEDDLESYAEGEALIVNYKAQNSRFTTKGQVTRVHIDEFGVLVQVAVDWAGAVVAP